MPDPVQQTIIPGPVYPKEEPVKAVCIDRNIKQFIEEVLGERRIHHVSIIEKLSSGGGTWIYRGEEAYQCPEEQREITFLKVDVKKIDKVLDMLEKMSECKYF